jgi:hypothetical protein
VEEMRCSLLHLRNASGDLVERHALFLCRWEVNKSAWNTQDGDSGKTYATDGAKRSAKRSEMKRKRREDAKRVTYPSVW